MIAPSARRSPLRLNPTLGLAAIDLKRGVSGRLQMTMSSPSRAHHTGRSAADHPRHCGDDPDEVVVEDLGETGLSMSIVQK
jgi:hypothetical protein